MPGMRAVLLAVLAVPLALAAPAQAATKVVDFEAPAPDTRLFEEYKDSHGVSFPEYEASRPVVRSAPGKARSGSKVGVYSVSGENFSPSKLIGQLKDSANAISAYVGFYSGLASGQSVDVRLRALNSEGAVVAESAFVTVTDNAPFSQQLSVSVPGTPTIDSFELDAPSSAGHAIGMDDLAITIDEAAPPPPPNFTLNQGQSVVDVLTGNSVDVPVEINRTNGSNGDISFAVTGLPAGMTASFNPNPVPGTNASTVMTLTAAEGAAHSDQYTEITVTATPTSPGAGTTGRSITKLVRIRENCDRTVRADFVDARSNECMVRRGNVYEATNAEVRVNGLIIKPADDSRPTLVIDPAGKTIKGRELTMPFVVSTDTDPNIPIYAGPLSWTFSTGDGNKPRKIIGFDLSGIPVLKSLPITGLEASFTIGGDTILKPTLRLSFWPFNYFGSITSTATFQLDNDNPPDFSGLQIKLAKVNALALELKDVELKWQQGNTWSGSAKLVVNFSKKYTIGAGFGIKEGEFDFLRGSVSGINSPIGAGIFLQSLGFEVKRDPLTLSGSIGLSGGPKLLNRSAVSIGGTLKAVLADPFVVEVNGSLEIVDEFKLADAFVRYSSTGLFEFGGKVGFDIWRLELSGSIDGWVDGLSAFNVEGSIDACLDVWGPNPCGNAKVLLSSKGIAGCVGVYGYYVGAGAIWGLPPDFDAFTGCDLAPYREIKPSSLRAAAELVRTRLPAGLPSAAWEVRAKGGPVGVTLTGPGGQAITVSRETPFVQQGNLYAQLREDGTTFVLVNKPAAGVWTLSDDGVARVVNVREARGLPAVQVDAAVGGRGRARVLRWRLRPIKGQRVTFAEVGTDVRNAIVSTSSRRGSVRFRPADGPAGRREIVAIVEQDGQPRTTQTVGSYRAPGRLRPGKPRRLRVRRSGSRLVVSWVPNPSGFRHALYFQLGDGRRLVQVVPASRRAYTLKGVPRSASAKVKAYALSAVDAKGPAASASIKRR